MRRSVHLRAAAAGQRSVLLVGEWSWYQRQRVRLDATRFSVSWVEPDRAASLLAAGHVAFDHVIVQSGDQGDG